MSEFIAALPMYDWLEARAETDALWAHIRAALLRQGIDAPARLVRRNTDMPPVPGGIRDAAGRPIAPDPASLAPDELDASTLWRHPKLIFGQTCWGPMEHGLADQVRVVGQPDYSAFEGGEGELYSSAVIMRRGQTSGPSGDVRSPANGHPLIPLDLLRGKRFAYNSPDSMSGIIALSRDLAMLEENLGIFGESMETGSHRGSVAAVAQGDADVCAVDCRTWELIRRFEPLAAAVAVVGWTGRRKGLPYISALAAPAFRLDLPPI